VSALQDIVSQHGEPELINDGSQTSPSKRIIECFPEYGKAKATLGPQIAERIGLETNRNQCRHFDMRLSKRKDSGAGVDRGG